MRKNGNDDNGSDESTIEDPVERLVSEVKQKGKNLFDGGMGEARDFIAHNADYLKKKAAELKDKTVDEVVDDIGYQVRRHPFFSIGIAFAAGYVLSKLFRSDR